MTNVRRLLGVLGMCGAAAAMAACNGEVRVDGTHPLALGGACAGEAGSVLVTLPAVPGMAMADSALDIDVCVGMVCGQAIVDVVEAPAGSVPEGSIVSDGLVGFCIGSPSPAVLDCAADPTGTVAVQVAVPNDATPGTSFDVRVTVRSMLGAKFLDERAGSVTLQGTDGCGHAGVYGEIDL